MATPPFRMPVVPGAGVLRRSSAAFCSSVPILLAVSLLLLSYRTAVHMAASHLAYVIDRDANVRSLFSRLSSPAVGGGYLQRPANYQHHGPGPPRRHRGRPSFLHFSRAGTLDNDEDDLFDDSGHLATYHPLRSHRGRPFNTTFFVNHSHLLHLLGAEGEASWLPAARRTRVLEPTASPILFVYSDNANGGGDREDSEGAGAEIDIQIFGQSFHLRRRDAVALAYLVAFFSALYCFATVGFLYFYSGAIGVVFLAVTDSLLGRRRSFLKTVSAGCRLGVRRVMSFVFLQWVVRDAIAQFLCILLFSDVGSQQAALKLFIRAKLIPFMLTASPLTQWTRGDEGSLWWFLFVWGLLDRVVPLVFSFSCWVAVADYNRGRRGPQVLLEGFRIFFTMMDRALILKQVEMMICWNSGRWFLTAIGGSPFAAIIQSVLEVYFMVVWLVCYFDKR